MYSRDELSNMQHEAQRDGMDSEFDSLVSEGYLTHPDDEAQARRFDALCDKFEAQGKDQATAIAMATKNL